MHEGSYELTFGERGARVAFVSSEPITGWSVGSGSGHSQPCIKARTAGAMPCHAMQPFF
jgi:hypothetical protein